MIVLLILLIPAAVALRGWVLMTLWLWFVVPLGVVEIRFWHAVGISTLVSYLWYTPDADDEREPLESLGRALAHTVGVTALSLGVAAVAHSAM